MQLSVQKRDLTGKKVKQLRKQQMVPGVVYGRHLDEPVSLLFDKVQLVKAIHKAGTSTPVTLKGDGIEYLILFHDYQLDPVSDHLIHVDCLAVNKDEKVSAEVQVVLVGESPYEKSGEGRVQLIKDTLYVEALPLDLPHEITINVENLTEAGQTIHVKDIIFDERVTLLDEPELTVASTVEFREEVEEEEETTAEGEEGAAGEAAEWGEASSEEGGADESSEEE